MADTAEMVLQDAVKTLSWLRRAKDQISVADLAGYAFPPTLLARVKAGLDEARARAEARADADPGDVEAQLKDQLEGRDVEFVALMLDFFRALGERYFDWDVLGTEHLPRSGGALLVSNHSGGVVVSDAFLTHVAVYDALGLSRPVHCLAHDFAFDEPVLSRYMRRFGVLRAQPQLAQAALEAERLVLVYPGSDRDAYRPFSERHRVSLSGRKGFVRLAKRAGVPIIPVVSVGTHEQLVVLARGERLGRALKTRSVFRSDCLPVTLSVPWGLSVGFLPYVPLPAQTTIAFGEAIDVASDDDDDGYARVEGALQALMDKTVDRRQERRKERRQERRRGRLQA
jgi:1-acyl-sn-glycerol-3-phosphate acyltransferase